MIWTIAVVLTALWLLGIGLRVGGSLIHLLLVAALLVWAGNAFSGRREA